MKRILPILFFTCSYIAAFTQKDCRQQDYQQRLLLLHPQLNILFSKIDTFSVKHPFLPKIHGKPDTLAGRPVPEKIIIPVVVHILWNSHAQNISDAQVLSQIDALNKDFNGLNADRNKIPAYFSSLAADCGIIFALAKTDPQGRATNGIVRTQTPAAVFNFDDKVKRNTTGGADAWNAASYLNIWVCNLVGGVSGYASIPGGSAATDGVVISTAVFGTINRTGPFNKGRTAVHEIGHWLNLRHIWGDASCGDDKVGDTPAQQGPNRGCNSGEKFTCGSTLHGDMYMNFMDFTDDACMYMFTKGQQQRMRAMFEHGGPRNSLLYSNALAGEGLPLQGPVPVPGFDLMLYPNPATDNITLQLTDYSSNTGTKILICNHLGQIVKTVLCTSKLQRIDISRLQAGLYFIRMEGMEGSVMKKFVKG